MGKGFGMKGSNVMKVINSRVSSGFMGLLAIACLASCAETREMPSRPVEDEHVAHHIWLDVGLIEIINNDTVREKGIWVHSGPHDADDGRSPHDETRNGVYKLYPRAMLLARLENLLRCRPKSEGKILIVIDKMGIKKIKGERYEINCELIAYVEKGSSRKTIKVAANGFREFTGEYASVEKGAELVRATNGVIDDAQNKILEKMEDFIIN